MRLEYRIDYDLSRLYVRDSLEKIENSPWVLVSDASAQADLKVAIYKAEAWFKELRSKKDD